MTEFAWKPEYRNESGMAGTPAYYEAATAWSAKQLEEGLASVQLGAGHSAQLDTENGTLLIAGPDCQQLLTAEETMRLAEFLYEQKGKVFAAVHQGEDTPHPDACHCDACEALRFAMCGYED